MRILFVTTKAPWPTVDGGRLLVANTLDGLLARGHQVTVVAAVDPSALPVGASAGVELRPVAVRGRSYLEALARSRWGGPPAAIGRHSHEAVTREIAHQLAAGSFDLVHAEQLQALSQARPAFERGVPVVLRAQNVESDLWAAALERWPLLRGVGRREVALLAAAEGAAVARSAATVALTERDAQGLRRLAVEFGGGEVTVVRAPFASLLPAGQHPLPGAPAVVLLGSGGWAPNRDAARTFVAEHWPEVRRQLPAARLHVFGGGLPSRPRRPRLEELGVVEHPPLANSRDAFAQGAVLVVPLRIASGVRMRILEAWARGVPVIAGPEAAAGLDADDGVELLLARDGRGFATALRRLLEEPGLAARLTAAGRRVLARWHDPVAVAARLEQVYERVLGRASAASGIGETMVGLEDFGGAAVAAEAPLLEPEAAIAAAADGLGVVGDQD